MGSSPDLSEPMEPVDPAETEEEYDEDAYFRKRRRKLLRTTIAVLILMALATGLHEFWPWLTPPFVYEGPMVQATSGEAASLVWFMSRPVGEGVSIAIDEGARVENLNVDGKRCVARFSGLKAGADYSYRIELNGQELYAGAVRGPKPIGESFSFIAFGDSGMASAEQYLLAARMNEFDPDFILHTGDIVYPGGERQLYKARMFQPYREMLARVCFWPSIGNHDVRDLGEQSAYFDIYELPANGPEGVTRGHDYWFDYGTARVVVIDSEHDEETLARDAAPWVRDVLSNSDAEWKIALFHRPPYTAGSHDPCLAIRNALSPVFEEVGIDLALSGHDHMYERTKPIRGGKMASDGPIYIVTGAGGARLYDAQGQKERPDYIAVIKNKVHSFTYVVVDGGSLTLEQISIDGDVLDRLTLNKSER